MDNCSSNDRTNSTKPVISWFWKSNQDPWSTEEEKWTPYSAQDNILIEQEYSKNKQSVEVAGNYILYFQSCLQVHKHDPYKLRPIKRGVNLPEKEEYIKEKLILPPPKRISSTNIAGFKKHPSLIYEFNPEADKHNSYSRKDIDFAVRGILEEGILHGPEDYEKSRMIAFGLLERLAIDENFQMQKFLAKESVFRTIMRLISLRPVEFSFYIENPAEQRMLLNFCLKIYTQDNFLYRSINKALREEDLSKSNTLGPFCFLLNQFLREFSVSFPGNKYFYNKTVYRGACLSKEALEEYKAIFNSPYPAFCWNGFTSASKKELIARIFGDILFIIDMPFPNCGAMDISSLSQFPGEEEVLFPAGSIFKIKKIVNDSIIQLERIDIKQIPFSAPNYKHPNYPRIGKELRPILEAMKMEELDYSAFVAMPLNQNLVEWKALIPGSSGTFYDGYIFQIYINVPSEFPFLPLKFKSETKIWHPNISLQSGDICLFYNKDWSPAFRFGECIILVQALLSTPNNDQPLETMAAEQLRNNPQEFANTIKSLCTDAAIIGKKVRNLIEKGVKPCQAKLALMIADFDEERAFSLCRLSIEELYQAKITENFQI